MRAFITGVVAIAVIAVVAFVALNGQQVDTAQTQASDNVRLPTAN